MHDIIIRKGHPHGTGRFIARTTDLTGIIDVRDMSTWGRRGGSHAVDDAPPPPAGGAEEEEEGDPSPRVQAHDIPCLLMSETFDTLIAEGATGRQQSHEGGGSSGGAIRPPPSRGHEAVDPLQASSSSGSSSGSYSMRAYLLKGHPGLIVIPGVLSPEMQLRLVRNSLSLWPEPPANTNHTLRYVCETSSYHSLDHDD